MIVAALMLASVLSAGSEEFDRAANEGAAKIVIARLRETVETPPEIEGRLKTAMLADPARFAARADAEREGRLVFAAEAEAQFARNARDVLKRLAGAVDPCDAFGTDFVVDATAYGEADRARALTPFAGVFDRARAAACAEQAAGLVGSVRPTEAEFDAKDETALRQEMTERIAAAQAKPVFEENLKYISESIVDPMLDGAKKERLRQGELLVQARCDAYAPSRLAAELKERLETDIAERRAKAVEPASVWGAFPSVIETALPKTVERRTMERVTAKIDEAPVEVTAAGVIEAMAGAPELHVKPDESEKVFRGIYAGRVMSGAIELAAEGCPDGERAEFTGYAADRFSQPEVVKAVEARVVRDILPKWREARAQACAEEASTVFPELVDRTWYPAAELADETAARSDYGAAVKGWRQMPALSALADAGRNRPVMEETSEWADGAVLAAFDLARGAIAAQNQIVENVHPQVLAESIGRKESIFRRTPDFKAVVALLTERTEERWRETRRGTLWPDGQVPGNFQEQHAALFPSVRRKIELVARTILEEMNAEKVKAKGEGEGEGEEKPEEPPPEEKPEEPPPEEPPEEPPPEEPLLEFSILVNREGENVKVKLEQGGKTVAERLPKAQMGDFADAMKFIADKLGREILQLK